MKQKKKMNIYGRVTEFGKKISLAVCIGALLGTVMPVYGAEQEEASAGKEQAPRVVITDIYHRHIGNTQTQGGCYNVPVSHVHQGDEKTKGGCYQIPVYHRHQGSADTKGGCYTQPVAHQHKGDTVHGGECFVPDVIHTHTQECMETKNCLVSFTPERTLETMYDTCFKHQWTVFVKSRGTEVHDSCDKGTTTGEWIHCQSCGVVAPMIHQYEVTVCGLEQGSVLSYKRKCNKEVDSYKTGCQKTEKDIDKYDLDCDKKVDGYALDCELDENTPCGRLVVTNESDDQTQQVTLSAVLEDFTEGGLKVSGNSYVWQDEEGNRLGEGKYIQVNENGAYFVSLRLENEDVNEQELCSQILVDNICKVQPTSSSMPVSSAMPTSSAMPASSAMPTASPSVLPSAKPSAFPSASPIPTQIPAASPAPSFVPGKPSKEENTQAASSKEDDGNEMMEEAAVNESENESKQEKNETGISYDEKERETSDNSDRKSADKVQNAESTPSPADTKPIKKETKKVSLPEKKGEAKIMYQPVQKERKESFFDSPTVRMFTITAGAALLLLGLALFLLYLRRSVKIYNDDGEGKMIYLGRCIVRWEEDFYAVAITEAMEEKAYTNRYCIRPGLFRIGKKEGEELVIIKGEKRVAVYLSREMIVMI